LPQIVCKYLLGGMGNTYQVFSMRTEILLTVSILSLLCLTGLGDVGTIEYWLTKGAEEYVNGSLKEAFRSFDNATTVDPENATVWFARGMALSGLKRYEEAISSYNKSIRIDDKNADVWYARATDESYIGRMNDSLASYDQSLQIDPENKFVWYDKGNSLLELGRYEESITCYDQAILIDGNWSRPWDSKGYAQGELGRYEEALQSFEESIDIYPNSSQSWYGKALALRSLGRAQEAEEAWSTYLDLSYAHISFSDNRGESMEDAIVIMNARTDLEGVGSEYYYLEKRFGTDAVDRDRISQYLVEGEEGRSYDVLEVHLTSGENATIYFDITDFYGKGFV